MPFDVEMVREQFPALSVSDHDVPRIYLDNPAGTQVPSGVIRRIENYLTFSNANHEGKFRTSKQSDAILREAHVGMADFLNAPSENEIVFGPNMTTLAFALSRSLAHWFKRGDSILLTRMDHDANVAPWLLMAEDKDLEVKWLDFDPETCVFDMEEFATTLSDGISLAAFPYASNALGTVNDVRKMTALAHDAGALVFVDAVHFAPHGSIDVQQLGCDFLVCSTYKFFGPHQGILWGMADHLNKLPAYKVRPSDARPPGKFETGTQNHECQAGVAGTLDYLASLGDDPNATSSERGRVDVFKKSMDAIRRYEKTLTRRLVEKLSEIPGLRIYGITSADALDQRVPTVSFTLEGWYPAEVAKKLAEENIFVWDGNYYAVEVTRKLGLEESGGMVRVGAVHYNTADEIDRLVSVLHTLEKTRA